MSQQHTPAMHEDASVRKPAIVEEEPLHDVDDIIRESGIVEAFEAHVSMVKQHTPTMHAPVPKEGIEELSDDTHERIIKERLQSMQNDAIERAMVEQQFFAVHESTIPKTETFEQRHDNVLESDVVERQPHTEQDNEGDDLVETALHTIMDNTFASAMAERRIIELPIELHEHIIGFLDNWDVETIANCALVCHRWVPFSRFKLYHCVRLNYRQQWSAFERLMSLPASSPMAGYLRKVHQLHINPNDQKFLDKERKRPRIGWRKGQERGWTHTALVRSAAYFPAVTRIRIDKIDWSEHYHVVALHSGSTWRSLTTLVLHNCKFASVVQLHLFVTAFPTLKHLSLGGNQFQSKKPSCIPRGGHPLSSVDLFIDTNDMRKVIQWLAGARLMQSLADLRVSLERDTVDTWKTLSEAIDGSALQKLRLSCPQYWKVTLSCFTSLRWVKLDYHSCHYDTFLYCLESHLFSISSDQVEELDIDFVHFFNEVIILNHTLDGLTRLKRVDDLLAGSRFARLRRVALQLRGLEIWEEPVPNTSPSPSGGSVRPISGSSSRPDPSDQLVSAQPKSAYVGLNDQQPSFKDYAALLVRHKILDVMKQLDTRGILELYVSVMPRGSIYSL